MAPYKENPHVLAEGWRLNVGLSRAQLSALTGYSIAHIQNMECGKNMNTGKPISAKAFNRYKLICATVHAGLRFDWKTCTIAYHKGLPDKKRAA